MPAIMRWTVLCVLLALRLPSIGQPSAADQSLYSYVGLRVLAGDVPYLDAWDQKPPGIHVIYGILWWLWPDERVVNVADLIAAAGVCVLLVVLGRRITGSLSGWLAAWMFALLANPSLHRLSGVFERSQCETFIALAVTAALVLASGPGRRPTAEVGAGLLMGIAIWLKYNAAVFALPIFYCLLVWRPARHSRLWSSAARPLVYALSGTAFVGAIGLGWIVWRGALSDLWLATIDYNIAYSGAAYSGPGAAVQYLLTMPMRQARHELLWFLGLAGVVLGCVRPSVRRAAVLGALWIAAATLAIAANGRDLPQYFVQATPALAFAASVGLTAAWQSRRIVMRAAVATLLLSGLWRVGTEAPVWGTVRFAGLPGLVTNVRFDVEYLAGRIGRRDYLERFGGQREQDKFAALDVDDLATFVGAHSSPGESILVFGFSPAVYVKAGRVSASRFFWSYPIVSRFAVSRPGYGPAGLVADLAVSQPSLVVLQTSDYPDVDSRSFFMNEPILSEWLLSRYRRMTTIEMRRYEVWRRIDGDQGETAQGPGAGGNSAPTRMASLTIGA